MAVLQFLFVLLMGHIMCTRVFASLGNAYVGCFGTDRVVHKGLPYKPTEECWSRCQKAGTDKLVIAGGRWCGCGSPMRPGEGNCAIVCRWIEPPVCDCYGAGEKNYFQAALKAAVKFVRNVAKPVDNKGYDCADVSREHWKELYPEGENKRTEKCRYQHCINKGTRYFAFIYTQRCGCKQTSNFNDNYQVPVTRDCVDKMFCVDLPYSVCLCGNSLIDPSKYNSKGSLGPLLSTTAFKCYSLFLNNDQALHNRKFAFTHVFDMSASPVECINICHRNNHPFAAIQKGGICTCQKHKNHRPFTNADCTSTCSKDTKLKVCGGAFTASVFKANPQLLVTTPAPRVVKIKVTPAPAPAPKETMAESPPSIDTDEEDVEQKEGDIIVENEDDFVIPGDDGGFIGMSNDVVMKIGGLAVGVIILAIVVICLLCRKGSDSSKKKKKKKKDRDKKKDRSPEEKEARRKRREERKRRKQQK
ncbi:uncharacterized protein LOC135473084 [Liolophura sinensis]|uniref:uncharacterized protein LOC135473084 n=1 Tax=Liolophura sinensis TaxID=3198878 RepID=UPI003158FD3F